MLKEDKLNKALNKALLDHLCMVLDLEDRDYRVTPRFIIEGDGTRHFFGVCRRKFRYTFNLSILPLIEDLDVFWLLRQLDTAKIYKLYGSVVKELERYKSGNFFQIDIRDVWRYYKNE